MEMEAGGKLKGVNGGRGKRVRRVGEFADPEHRRLVVGQGLEREHKATSGSILRDRAAVDNGVGINSLPWLSTRSR